MDPFASAPAALLTAIALALLFVLPGLALGPLLLPGAPTPLVVVGRAAGVSLLAAAGLCTLLAGLGLLRLPIVAAGLLALSLLPLAGRRVRQELRAPLSRLRRSRAAWLGGVAGTALAVAAVLVPSQAAGGGSLLPATSTVWYYLHLARSVAEAGRFPATLVEWGRELPFPTDYAPATAHAAAAMLLVPGEALWQLEWHRLGLLAAAVVLAALLFHRWLSSWQALLAGVALLATVRLAGKFLDHRPETFGLALALFTLWLADRALAERSRRALALAGAAAALTFLSHAEVFLLLGPGLLGLAGGRLLVARLGAGRLGLRRPAMPRVRRLAGACALIFVGGLIAGSLVNGLLTGHLRLLGFVAGSGRSVGALPPPPEAEMPPGWRFSGDPTFDFLVASVAPALVGQPPPSRFLDSRLLPRSILQVWHGLDGRDRGGLVMLGALLLLPAAAWPWLDARRRRMALTWWLFGGGLLAGSWLLFELSSTYVPARVGPRRLMPYQLMLPVAAFAIALWGLDRLLVTGWRALLPRRGAMLAAGAALALVTLAAIAPAPARESEEELPEQGAATSEVGYEALRWIDANLPPDARLLANAYTDGSIAAVARRPGILDGRAVYLESPALLSESTRLLLLARRLFLEPDGEAAAKLLERRHVTHLLVATSGPEGRDLGGYFLFQTDLEALRGSGRYTLLRTFGDGRVLLFRVERPPPPP
ncbi:MAG TPA: glycosyltransferase family 39 protein [Candidatus Limnocylindrales bacterium]|nr:glycosyltransferase family 39 protein [Candidatus Limnocylindrales bacterium]